MRVRWETGRTEAFSDGVFAIAITLLVLEIHIPPTELEELGHAIVREWPAYLGYATSFITIGGLWLAHHGLFARLRYVNRHTMRVNLVLLMAVSFLPFPTGLMAEAIHNEDAERAAVLFYGTNLLVISLLLGALWGTAATDRSLLRPDVDEEEIAAVVRATSPNIAFYLAALLVAIVVPVVAAFGYLAIAIVLVLGARGDTQATAAPG